MNSLLRGCPTALRRCRNYCLRQLWRSLVAFGAGRAQPAPGAAAVAGQRVRHAGRPSQDSLTIR
ncbi:hypothetical protein [Streptomyces sp. Root1310]|uniref:hypothetical protein n=1 Tax=Streptomyces sp. Root1310 TaxID=1736452 RepID=UPI000AB92205|nr:hypothetical protein [Streptomyces sp. Root1310]